MAINSKAPLGDGALPKQMTAHADSSAFAVCDDTTPHPSGGRKHVHLGRFCHSYSVRCHWGGPYPVPPVLTLTT
jgi:hypothetical protein